MQLKYGKITFDFDPPIDVSWTVLEKNIKHATRKESDIIKAAVADLANQLEHLGIPKFSKLLLVIPDHTRRCRLEAILPILTIALENRFSATVQILVANGSHVLQPEETIREIVGGEIYEKYPITQHDCKDKDSLAYFGDSSKGTQIWLNRKVKEADFIITVGGVLYHYFAGFGGGPKMLLPGVAGYETIRANHRRTIDEKTGHFHPDCYEGYIETNPVFLDLKEVMKFVSNTISLQVVQSVEKKIVHAAAGPILPTHRRICEKVSNIYSIPLTEKADVVVASAGGFPSDVNLIQSHKSIHHAFQAVKENGWVIILAECAEGIGSKTFLPYFDVGSSGEIAQKLLQDYQINGHTALSLKTKTEIANIVLVSKLEADTVKKTGMISARDPAQAWSVVAPNLKKNSTGYIMPMASVQVPIYTR